MGKTISLMYHCVYNEYTSESGFQNESAHLYKVKATEFEKQVIAINRLIKNVDLFTFDDGGVSFYSVIAPILEKHGVRGVFFISTKYIGTEKFLTKQQIQDLHKRGHIIASHSHSHPDNISSLSQEEIRNEWQLSKDILSEIIGEEVTSASIPNGYASKDVYAIAEKCGYNKLYISKPTTKVSYYKGMEIIGRYVIHDTTELSTIMNIITSSGTRFKYEIRWVLISFVKLILGNKFNKVKMFLMNIFKK